MTDETHENDHSIFVGEKLVLINIETSELHVIDKIQYGFGDTEREVDTDSVKANGFEILSILWKEK